MKMVSLPRAERKRKPRDQRWEELLRVSALVFYRKGYDGASLQEIADELGIMKGSLYYYIRSKEDILFALLSSTHQAGVANVAALAATEGNALERLGRLIMGHIGFVSENVVQMAIFLREMKALPEARQKEILETGGSYAGIVRQVLLDGQGDGSIRGGIDPDLTATLLITSLNAAFRWIPPADADAAQRIGAHYAQIFTGGLQA